ncbi:arf-GAP with dual PH domain-containing protein 2-like isoform X1 [Hippocampus zosterae]|uniref:arf-GAP with dual PH domain-containing protein 2-like isoform X1 n=2 Tax=Hippocampus zosterae TaxID=109293 RepID=UPI00223E4F31|nr:arf-GAP with dual PH domain-containing protein 2-like isoform X1 [Hippocampus zosterae]XP_051940078.1 arf-GAP with dual PH domain-containing protein 2-like isoform X1 [Hippocampus zosterae]
MANLERNNKILLDLVRQPWNNTCADCGAPEPDWASYTLCVFLCVNCSGMHRNLPSISKVKSIRLDHWQDSLVEAMSQRGNLAAKATYEKCVPAFIYRPEQRDCVVLKDQWIRAKYERREFIGEKGYFQQSYGADTIEETLWKKGKDNRHFLKRIFLLSHKDFTLRYFTKQNSRVPKAVISMKELNAVFQPEKIGHAHGLQISYLQEVRTRNIFVYHENGQVIVSFFNAIRATRLAYLQKKHPTLRQSELVPQLTRHCLKEGYMEKTGPTQREPFKKRWFTLCALNRKLLYYKSPLDATELGAVFIGTESHGYLVLEGSRRHSRGGRWHCAITLHTPDREFVFMCEQELEQQEWLQAFGKVIGQPMTPEDYANEANMRRCK